MFSSLFSMSGFDSLNKKYSLKKDSLKLDRTQSTNAFKTVNGVRTLPLIKSKSTSFVKPITEDINRVNCSDPFSAGNARRRLSWFERKSWSFRKANKRNIRTMDSSPDITIIFTKDASEWDEYLTECFSQMIDYQPLTILHERIENINFPIGCYEAQNFSDSRAVLLILSPDLLDYIDAHAEVFELSRLLNPKRTVVMLCGVHEQDISRFHKAALVSYDQWTCLVAKDQDKEFVLNVIQTVLLIMQQSQTHSSNKPQFKLTPRKVREGNGKVFVLLENPISDKQQSDILLDGSNECKITVKWKNPYCLYFTIPDSILKVARVVNVSLILDGKNFIGTRALKCETKMSELHSLLTAVNSPFEFMCQTLGFATLSEVDAELTNRFSQCLPNSGIMFLNVSDGDDGQKKKSDCYLPTLLHFASAYGLRELTSKLLQCPSALKACLIRNSCNLTPAEIAYHLNHNDIGIVLEDFQRLCESEKINIDFDVESILGSELTDQEKANLQINCRHTDLRLSEAHHQLYGIPFSTESIKLKHREQFSMKNNDYVDNESESIHSLKSNFERQNIKNEFDLNKMNKYESGLDIIERAYLVDYEGLSELNNKNCIKNNSNSETSIKSDGKSIASNSMTRDSLDLDDIHKELLYIIETFKKGMSFDRFESLFEKWQSKYENVLNGNLSKDMDESLRQIQALCKIGRKQHKLESNVEQTLSFNDLRYYLTSKLHNRKTNNPSKQNSFDERLHNMSFKNKPQKQMNSKYTTVSPSLSSISTNSSSDQMSTISNASLFDSGNHSAESHDENHRNYRNNYYTELKVKNNSFDSRLSQLEGKSNSTDIMRCSKPPAPPPRPLNVSISESNKFKACVEPNHYYLYENKTKLNTDKLDSSDYVMTYCAENSNKEIKDENIISEMQPNLCHTKSHSLSGANSHEYINMISSKTDSYLNPKRDPLLDYDLVPSGTPIPIEARKAILNLSSDLLRRQAEADYDIPKCAHTSTNKSKIKSELSIIKSNGKILANDRNTDRQVFV